MDNLLLKGTKTTPEISFDAKKGVLEISGESYPENALEFFRPVFDWLRNFTNSYYGSIVLNFRMIYFNTSSSKAILDILDLVDDLYKSKNRDITVNWYYQEDDEDIQESGEEFAEGLSLPYNLISFE